MAKPIVVRLTRAVDSYPRGAELGFATVAQAETVLGEGAFRVDRYQDGSAYDKPKAASGTAGRADSEPDAPPSLGSMTRAELDVEAERLGVTGEFATKADVIVAIEALSQEPNASDEGATS